MKIRAHRNIALVTGGARRLGKYISLALAENGFDVVVNFKTSRRDALKTKKEIETLGKQCLLVQADVSNSRDVARMFTSIKKTFGRIDVVVNNAGIFEPSNLFSTTEQRWEKTLATNLKSVFLVSKAAAEIFQRQNSGTILNISSVGGIKAWKGFLAYSVAKAGVIQLTKILARELAPYVRVNAIAPGTIAMSEDDNSYFDNANVIPMNRYGVPSDITSLVVYLATTSQYITGQTFAVDGGKSIL
ncbi:MAG: SDR family oxidoreductase [Ignavibacteria bacterium]|nr:SDR family oxidoreductase [Ignavibacteria bacterium]